MNKQKVAEIKTRVRQQRAQRLVIGFANEEVAVLNKAAKEMKSYLKDREFFDDKSCSRNSGDYHDTDRYRLNNMKDTCEIISVADGEKQFEYVFGYAPAVPEDIQMIKDWSRKYSLDMQVNGSDFDNSFGLKEMSDPMNGAIKNGEQPYRTKDGDDRYEEIMKDVAWK